MDLVTLRGTIRLPTFFPDATVGVVRSVDSKDLEDCGVEGLVVSTFHLLTAGAVGKLGQLMSWRKPILADSGGFQVFSLLRDQPRLGKVTDQGFIFNWNGKKIELTPEGSIEFQFKLGADILVCLDQCTDPKEGFDFQKRAVERTISWAKRCKRKFNKMTKSKNPKPLLFAVIQGGNNLELREDCARRLIKIGFDGYCYGGWPLDEYRKPLYKILEYTARLMPDDKPKYALGIGRPEDIIACVKMGYGVFDCVIPTREARHKKLYLWKGKKSLGYTTLTLNSKISNSKSPLSNFCDCLTCQNFSKAYLYHLFKLKDTLSFRLTTIHNLRFYTTLMERLKAM